jgi:cell cycle checkpoint control protein RAD9A
MPPPSFIPPRTLQNVLQTIRDREPLFLPVSSQLSVADQEAIKASGLGIEDMGPEEVAAMLEGDGDEVGLDFGSQAFTVLKCDSDLLGRGQVDDAADRRGDSFGGGDEMELAATQTGSVNSLLKVGLPGWSRASTDAPSRHLNPCSKTEAK